MHNNIAERVKNFMATNADETEFVALALEIFRFQYENNPVYRSFARHFVGHHESLSAIEQIPFLPVQLFKNHKVYCGPNEPQLVFGSSRTTSQQPSLHYVADAELYELSFLTAFRMFYGNPSEWHILCLLPGYTDRNDSSLVYMANRLIEESGSSQSGFYLENFESLSTLLHQCIAGNRKVLLLGVTHALLRFANACKGMSLNGAVVMETGGMKGHGREMVRQEVHQVLQQAFGLETIHSEYGMTELLSQAYSYGEGLFVCPHWMRVLCRETDDPLSYCSPGRRGGLNIIDLANVYSCSFIATHDTGIVYHDGRFEVSGRFDHAEVRGCNLLV